MSIIREILTPICSGYSFRRLLHRKARNPSVYYRTLCTRHDLAEGTNATTYPESRYIDIKPVTLSTSVDEYPLSREEAFGFVSDTLGIPNFQEVMKKQGKTAFLNTLLHRLKHTVPITNVTAFTMDNDMFIGNEMLFLEKCKDDMLSCRSGQCLWISGFFNALLTHLQYRTTVCGAGDKYSGILNAHASVIVHNLETHGSRHLADSSPTYPIFEAVPLDFDQHSESFIRFGKRWRFFHSGNGLIKLCNLIEEGKKRTFPFSEIIVSEGEQWEEFMDYRTRRHVPLSQFTELCLRCMTTSVGDIYRRTLYIHGFSRVIGKWVTVQNKIWIRDEDGVLVKSMRVRSDHDMIDRVTEYFPQYPASLIETCLKNIREYKSNQAVRPRSSVSMA